MRKIAVGMSGGVDSSAAAVLLKNSGYEVMGVTLKLYGEPEDISDAALVAKTLGIEHTVPDFSEKFRNNVIDPFVSGYESGRTPNPCLICNKRIKFGAMLDYALENGCDGIATGHYVRREYDSVSGRYLLKKPVDVSKDQSYVLYSLNQKQLSHSLFPLGEYTKPQIRALAADAGLEIASKPDSQDICFVPDGEYAEFIERYRGAPVSPGEYVDTNGKVLGNHGGVIRYTIGQRKGLGIALGRPIFVVSKDAESRRVTLGDEELLFSRRIRIKNVNLIPLDSLTCPMRVAAKIRYNQKEQPAWLHPVENGYLLEFDEPQRAATPGQAAVFYDGEILIGGGTITGALEE